MKSTRRSAHGFAKDRIKEQREAKNETLVESTFHNIVDCYADPEALSTALIEVKEKFKDLQEVQKQLVQSISLRDHYLYDIQTQMEALLELAGEDEKRNLVEDQADLATSKLPNESNMLQRTEERISDLAVDIEKSKMFIKILEGVQGVSAAGGIKRPRNDAVKEESENKKLRIC